MSSSANYTDKLYRWMEICSDVIDRIEITVFIARRRLPWVCVTRVSHSSSNQTELTVE